MPERTDYTEGTPSWVDLTTPDIEAACAFYGGLFGWTNEETGPVEDTGGYRFLLSGGRKVAGVTPIMEAGQPAVWSTYFAADDLDALAGRIAEAGGSALMEPMDVMDAGRMGFFAHPAGGMFGAWQAGSHNGAELFNEPVSLCWNTLLTPDVEGAKAFFAAIFGLGAAEQGGSTVLLSGDDMVAGVMELPPEMPEGTPAHWTVAFAVADADASVARAQELGGSLMAPPWDMPGIGRIGIVSDPFGAAFTVAALLG